MMKPIEYLVTSEEMQRYDANTIQKYKVPGIVLMEQAALGCLEEIMKEYPDSKKVLVLAGKGNNGGDAMALARLLYQKQYIITVCLVSNSTDISKGFSESAYIQYEILTSMGIPVVTKIPDDSYDIIVDGIFGVGLCRDITGNIEESIKQINSYSGHKISIDMPSGIDATTGKIYNVAFKADMTITFAFLKRGLYLLPGARYAGKIIKCNIGITQDSFFDKPPVMFTLTGNIHDYLPARDPFGHKGTFGKICLIAGSYKIGGAAILAGKASLISGCGMLRICTHKEHKSDILAAIPEAIIDIYENREEAIEQITNGIEWADVIAIGPGLGTDNVAEEIVKTVIKYSNKPLVMDADALNLLANQEVYSSLKKLQNEESTRRNLILTPHPLELARVCHCNKTEIKEYGMNWAIELAKDLNAVVIKKDANTFICNDMNQALNLIGNSGMATAGSGDVLCGITAALMALDLSPFDVAVLSVYLHALAGDYAAKEKNEYSILASDIINGIAKALC